MRLTELAVLLSDTTAGMPAAASASPSRRLFAWFFLASVSLLWAPGCRGTVTASQVRDGDAGWRSDATADEQPTSKLGDEMNDGGDGGDGAGDTQEVSFTLEDYVDAICAYDERCLAELGKVYSDLPSCIETTLDILACGIHWEMPMFETTHRPEIDAARLPGCITALAATPCEELQPTECDRVIRWVWKGPQGLAEIGQSCQYGFCIVDALCTVPEETGFCAVCTAPLLSQLSEACSDSQSCDEGFTCNSITGTCVLAAPVGAGCSEDAECRSGHCPNGQCIASIYPGRAEPCSTDGGCRANLVCLENVCTDRLTLGEACAFDEQCVANAICRAGQCESFDSCERSSPLGGPCVYGGCADGTHCNRQTHTCVPLPEAGAPCVSPVACPPNLRCDLQEMVCATGKIDGQSCSMAFECASNSCVQNICRAPTVCTMP